MVLEMLDTDLSHSKRLRTTFGEFVTGVCVVTLLDNDGSPTGVTVNSFSSLSLDPPLCVFSIGNSQASLSLLAEQKEFVVNVLSASQEEIAWQFAKPSRNKFANVKSRPSVVVWPPSIDGSLAHFECIVSQVLDGGDHKLIMGAVRHFWQGAGDPLVFHRGKMSGLCG